MCTVGRLMGIIGRTFQLHYTYAGVCERQCSAWLGIESLLQMEIAVMEPVWARSQRIVHFRNDDPNKGKVRSCGPVI